MRLFIAVNLPPATRDTIYADAAALRAATSAIRWVAPGALHVTMKFLGEQDERLVEDLRGALEGVAARHAPLDVRTSGMGVFPNFRRPRVVWLGMTGEVALRALAGDIDRALEPLGIPRETRAFHAHLTLGRVTGALAARDAAALEAAARTPRPARGFPVRTIDLMQSEPGPGGSRYTVLAAVSLLERGP